MKQITTLVITLAFTSMLHAQMIQFQKTYDGSGSDRGWSVAQTSDGGYIVAGQTNSVGAGSYDAYLIKTDANGTTQWTRTYGGTGYDWVYTAKQTADGGYIAIGGTESSGNGLGDMWIFKTNSSGVVSWQRTCGGSGGDSGYDIILTSDGGYAATGFQNDPGGTGDNACLIKMDGSGNIQWVRTYSESDDEYAYTLAQTSDGGYVLGGDRYDNVNFIDNALVIKTDAAGNVQWANVYGGPDDHVINGVKVLPSGDFIVGGATLQALSYDVWLARLNPNGTPVWSKAYAGGSNTEVCYAFTSTSDGGYALCGRSNSFTANFQSILIKTDSTGAPVWSKRYGGVANGAANKVIQSSNGGYVIANSSLSFGTGECVYLVKTDTNGVSGCNEGIPAFLMTSVTTPYSGVTIIDSSLTNVAGATLASSAQTLTENSLCFTVGGTEIASADDFISLYPNPASAEFTIGTSGRFAIQEAEIYSSLGEKIFSQNETADSQQQKIYVDAHGWSGGVYLVRIKTEVGIFVKRLVKQ